MKAMEVFNQNDGDVTRAYYAEMNALGPAGELAVALFRAQKRSTAAKRYRGGRYRRSAYEVKTYSLSEICRILTANPGLVERWGWKVDPVLEKKEDPHCQVLYVDLPTGQCSFHSESRLQGPDYSEEWDGKKESAEKIVAYCDEVAAAGPGSQADASETPPAVKPPNRAKRTRYEAEIERGGGRLML